MARQQLTPADRSTLSLALSAWIARCDQEAKTMRQWALDMPEHADKCTKNAEASEDFARQARELSMSGRL